MAVSISHDDAAPTSINGNGYENGTEATSSKVTLEDLRRRAVLRAEDEVKRLKISHAGDLRDLYVLHDQHAKGAPPTAPLELPQPDSYETGFSRFHAEHRLRRSNSKGTISGLKLPSSSALRRRLAAEINSASSPQKALTKEKGKAAVKDSPVGQDKGKRPTDSAGQSNGTDQSRLSPKGDTVASAEAGAESESSQTVPAPQTDSQTSLPENVDPPQSTDSASVTIPADQKETQPAAAAAAPAAEAQVAPVEPTPAQPSAPETSGQTDPTISTVEGQSATQTSNPLPPAFPLLEAANYQPVPLHPTLQVLAPNPLSVTYASSLRPLPPDPFRKYTGTGVGGGAVLHRSRKALNSSSSHAKMHGPAGNVGPAGNGQTNLWRWYVRSRASPGSGLVTRADKCLLTKDWKIAFAEQRFVRAMDRIEKLKEAGTWSFKQPKKQKGPLVRKSHWDHLMEEMKWLQTDFREERRWKVAVAFELAHACRQACKARKRRLKMSAHRQIRRVKGIGSGAVRGQDHVATEEQSDQRMQVSEPSPAAETAALPEGPSGTDEKDAMDQTADANATSTAGHSESAREAVADVEMTAPAVNAAGEAARDVAAKIEAKENKSVDEDGEGEEDADGEADADGDADDGEVEAATMAMMDRDPHTSATVPKAEPLPPFEVVHEPLGTAAMPALTDSSTDTITEDGKRKRGNEDGELDEALAPLASSDSALDPSAAAAAVGPDGLPLSVLTTLRAPIFSMGTGVTSVSPTSLLECFDAEGLSQTLGVDLADCEAFFDVNSISSLFPELPEYSPPSAPESGKGDKRWDEGSLSLAPRLTQVSRLLDTKPILVSTLEPSKNRAQGRWLEDSEWVLAAKMTESQKGLGRPELDDPSIPATTIFSRRSNKPSKETSAPPATFVRPPHQPEIRAAQILWTADEDALLMKLYAQYGTHWPLIADVFNSTCLCCPTDRREPWDCMDRWERITKAAAQGLGPPPPPPLPPVVVPGSDTQQENGEAGSPTGSALPPGSSVAAKREKLQKKLISKFDGSRRNMRHSNIVEVMRKTAKRRELTSKAQPAPGEVRKVNLACHETHNTPKGGQIPTPQQLSSLKADRDEAQMRQYLLYQQRRQQEEASRIAAAQAAAAQQQQQQQQQQQASQAQQSGQATAAGSQSAQANSQQRAQGQTQQQGQQQQPNAAARGMPMNQARPSPMPAPRPLPAGQNGGTSTPNQQQQQQPSSQGQQQQRQQTPQQRMTPQQQAMFAAQIRPPIQQQLGGPSAGQDSNASAGKPQGANGQAQQQQVNNNPLANMSPAALHQFQQTLQNTLAQSNVTQRLTPEQLSNLAMQLFRGNQAGQPAQRPPMNFPNLAAAQQQQQGQPRPPSGNNMQPGSQPRPPPSNGGGMGMQSQSQQLPQSAQQQGNQG